MKIAEKYVMGWVAGAFLVVGLFLDSFGYMTAKPYPVTVVGKMMVPHAKSRHSPVLVVQTADGYAFDMTVSVGTYLKSNEGDKMTFNLRPFDVRQTFWENLIQFFGVIVCMSIAAVLGLASSWAIIGGLLKKEEVQ